MDRLLPIELDKLPAIKACLTAEEYTQVVPKGYDDIVTAVVDYSYPTAPSLNIQFINAENVIDSVVRIPMTLLNHVEAKVEVPRFLLEKSSVAETKVEYFGKDSNLIINSNQMLYAILQHRLAFYARTLEVKSDRKLYSGLLNSDLTRLKQFIQYTYPNSYNALKRLENTYVLVAHHVWSNLNIPIGETLPFHAPDDNQIKRIFSDVYPHIRATSESSLSETRKLTLVKDISDALYRGPGYSMDANGNCLTWICASKQNIPSRQKSHLIADSYTIHKPSKSLFVQDNLFKDGIVTPKDNTLLEVVVAFHEMDKETARFVAGEIEITSKVANTLIQERESMYVFFKSQVHINVRQGKTYTPKGKKFLLGTDIDNKPVYLLETHEFTVTTIEVDPKTGSYRLVLDTLKKAGNARIVSQTGLKGVTKVKASNGCLLFPKEKGDSINSDFVQEYRFNTRVLQDTFNCVPVDMVVGMNSAKAKSNTIALSQALLAVKLGYYTPAPKGKNGEYKGFLNTLDENEINSAIDSLPEFHYLNEFGESVKVHIGLAYISFTELGKTYANWKPQTFPFEAGNTILKYSEELFNHIFSPYYMEMDKIEASKEFYTILNDDKCVLATHLPSYTGEQIRNGKLFTRNDLILSRSNVFRSTSKLLDEDFNQGFIINLTKHGGPRIRIPSAKVLNTFVNVLPNGEYSYHQLLIVISKIINAIFGDLDSEVEYKMGKLPRPKYEYIWKKYEDDNKRTKLYTNYLNVIQGILFSNSDQSHVFVQSFIKPMVYGYGLKQVTEPFLPDETIVVPNHKLIAKTYKESGYGDLDLDVLYKTIDDLLDIKEPTPYVLQLVDEILNDVPYVLTLRHPFLM